jgi:hypothetical protein
LGPAAVGGGARLFDPHKSSMLKLFHRGNGVFVHRFCA